MNLDLKIIKIMIISMKPDDETSLGRVIKVATRSINKIIDEYLVNLIVLWIRQKRYYY